MHPQIYVGSVPATGVERRALRALALELRAIFHGARAPEPTAALLHFSAGEGVADSIDLLLLRPAAAIVGAIRAYHGPVEARPGGQWSYRGSGEPIREARDRTPIQHVRVQRDAVRARLDQAAGQLFGAAPETQPFGRMIGALIVVPGTHPESQVSLDITDHREQIKVLGLDELGGLAAMVRRGPQLSEQAMRAIAVDLFGTRLWHVGVRFLFELAAPRFQLRVLADEAREPGERKGGERVLPLVEGESVIGRRRAPQQNERRVTLSGDELISADHALVAYGDDDRVTLRDSSKNGTWLTPPGGVEERVRGERTIVPGTLLRLGMTRLRLERVE